MQSILLLMATLLCACDAQSPPPVAAPATPAVAPAQAQAPGPNEFPLLDQSYGAAESAYKKKLDQLTKQGAPTTSLAHPAIEFLPRFQSLADRGEGRALLWMGAHLHEARPELGKDEAVSARLACYDRIIEEHAGANWIRDLARSLTSLYYAFGRERIDPLVERFVSRCKNPEALAEALYRAAAEARRAKDEARADALTERIKKDLPETEYGRRARGITGPAVMMGEGKVGLAIGNVAPEFTTKDADGVEFKLSDYRGKVVVLDFWGFW